MTDAIRVTLNLSNLSVDPGGTRDVVLHIENHSDVVDKFTLEFLGEAAGWATPDRNPVPIFAKGSESVTIKLRPPRAAFPVAGTIPLGIRVRSSVSPGLAVVEECRIDLNPFVEVAAEIRPKTSKGRFGATHRLRIINRGNTKATVSLQADVQQGDCTIGLPESPLILAAGERRTSKVRIRPSESHLTGPEEFHQFRIKVEPQGGAPPVSVDASMRQRAIVQVPTTLLVTAALVLGAAYVVYGKGLPGPGQQPHSNAISSAPPTAIQSSVVGTSASPVTTPPQSSPSAAPPPPPPPPSPTPLIVQSVAFAPNGNSPPILTVSGVNFGSQPIGANDDKNNCGAYTNNGLDFGSSFWLQGGNFTAFGEGTPPTGNCVGIVITSWSATQVVFTFGSAYNTFDHWYLSNGDTYVLYVKGLQFSGTVSFPPPTIQSVRFSKTGTAPPVVTVNGANFGHQPTGTNDNSTSCGTYANNGSDFGDSLWLQAGTFAAFGQGTPPSGSCVGLMVISWTATQAVFTFGSAYNSFDHWYISPGDPYQLHFLGLQYSGTVSFT